MAKYKVRCKYCGTEMVFEETGGAPVNPGNLPAFCSVDHSQRFGREKLFGSLESSGLCRVVTVRCGCVVAVFGPRSHQNWYVCSDGLRETTRFQHGTKIGHEAHRQILERN